MEKGGPVNFNKDNFKERKLLLIRRPKGTTGPVNFSDSIVDEGSYNSTTFSELEERARMLEINPELGKEYDYLVIDSETWDEKRQDN